MALITDLYIDAFLGYEGQSIAEAKAKLDVVTDVKRGQASFKYTVC